MAQSLSQIVLHVVFSTFRREPTLADRFRDDLHGYIGGIIARRKGVLLRAGSVDDHIHLLIAQPRDLSACDLVREIKGASSYWLNGRPDVGGRFRWQGGYGVFSVSPSHRITLERYIDRQAEHHGKVTFQDEYRGILAEHDVKADERYVWD